MKWLKPLLFQTHELAGPFRRYWKIANSVENMLCADVVRVQVALKWIKIKLNTFVQCRSRSFCTYNYLWMRSKERTVCGVFHVGVLWLHCDGGWLMPAILLSIFYAEQYQISTGTFRK